MNKKGFTLFELLIVIIIVGIVGGIVSIGYQFIVSSANEKALEAKEDIILDAALIYGEDHSLLINSSCEINKEYANCLVITIQDLIDEGYYKSYETCNNDRLEKCVYNDITKELMNNNEIIIYQNQYGINASMKNSIDLKINL